MDPFSLGAAAISAGGSLLGGMMGQSGQQATNAKMMEFQNEQRYLSQLYNTAEAQKSRDWQEEMSNTAYQRAMADMRAAGLNPIMAFAQGGASTPGGAQGSIGYSGASLGNPGALAGAGVSSAAQVGKFYADVAATKQIAAKDKSQEELNKASEGNTKAMEDLNKGLKVKAAQDTATSAAQQKQAEENAKNIGADTINKNIQAGILMHDTTTAAQRARLATREADDAERYGSGHYGQAVGAGTRVLDTMSKGGPQDGSDLMGRIVGRIINQFRSGTSSTPPGTPGPLEIDIRK